MDAWMTKPKHKFFKSDLFLCTCKSANVQMCGCVQSPVAFSISARTINVVLWERASHWDLRVVIKLPWLPSKEQRSACPPFPSYVITNVCYLPHTFTKVPSIELSSVCTSNILLVSCILRLLKASFTQTRQHIDSKILKQSFQVLISIFQTFQDKNIRTEINMRDERLSEPLLSEPEDSHLWKALGCCCRDYVSAKCPPRKFKISPRSEVEMTFLMPSYVFEPPLRTNPIISELVFHNNPCWSLPFSFLLQISHSSSFQVSVELLKQFLTDGLPSIALALHRFPSNHTIYHFGNLIDSLMFLK